MSEYNSVDPKEMFDEAVSHLIVARQQLEDANQAYLDNFRSPSSSQHWEPLSKDLDNAKRVYQMNARILTDFILMYKDSFEFKSTAE